MFVKSWVLAVFTISIKVVPLFVEDCHLTMAPVLPVSERLPLLILEQTEIFPPFTLPDTLIRFNVTETTLLNTVPSILLLLCPLVVTARL